MKLLITILFPVFTFSQGLTVSESSTYTYTKNNFGIDLFNVAHLISEGKNGSVWVQPYGREFYLIGNNEAFTPFQFSGNAFPSLHHVIEWKGMKYFFTNHYILISRNNRVIGKLHFRYSDLSSSPIIHRGTVYFMLYSNISSESSLYRFDGKRIDLLMSSPSKSVMHLLSKNKLYIIRSTDNQINISMLEGSDVIPKFQVKTRSQLKNLLQFSDPKNFVFVDQDSKVMEIKNGKIGESKIQLHNSPRSYLGYFTNYIDNHKYIWKYENTGLTCVANTSAGNEILIFHYSVASNSYYCGTGTNFLRLFPHIKKYPRLFHGNSFSVFSLLQDKNGLVWAGSYQGDLTAIKTNNTQTKHKTTELRFLSQGLQFDNQLIQFAEGEKGITLFNNFKQTRLLKDSVTAFCGLLSADSILYFGCPERHGLLYADARKLSNNGPINWTQKKGDKGFQIENIVALCEDRFGNIWAGGGNAIGVFNPESGKFKTWEHDKLKRNFLGARSICLDKTQTMWFGTRDGSLYYYDGKHKNDFSLNQFKEIKHPLFNSGDPVTFLHEWNDYLIIGVRDRVLLFNLKDWRAEKKIAVRYVNPMELNLTGTTEQNTILTDFRDESVWFSSSDMVYQWDIRKWLSLPVFHAKPTISVKIDSVYEEVLPRKSLEFEPTENSFSVRIDFQTKDNMPRYLNGALAKKGEKPVFEQPNLQTTYQFTNLSSGEYIFHVRICQQDGSVTLSSFPITIHPFIWQYWWFWGALSLIPFLLLILYFRKRNQLERQRKLLSQLSLSSLSNQFRPHFMLNALNSIGSQMDEMPHAEKVISRLGESITILYGFTQSNDFTHVFKNEWKLIENIIEIQRLLYIPDLQVKIEQEQLIPSDYKIPVGLIQIPVENALLHGLRNKTTGVCNLDIRFQEDEAFYFITIADNGVGRKAAEQINNFKKNGNGLKTVFAMIAVINKRVKDGVLFEIRDLESGTEVKIRMSKKLNYDKIQL